MLWVIIRNAYVNVFVKKNVIIFLGGWKKGLVRSYAPALYVLLHQMQCKTNRVYYTAIFISGPISNWETYISRRAFGPLADMCWGLMWGMIWKLPYQNLFIIYFSFWQVNLVDIVSSVAGWQKWQDGGWRLVTWTIFYRIEQCSQRQDQRVLQMWRYGSFSPLAWYGSHVWYGLLALG